MKPIICGIVAFVLSVFLCWYAGMDFTVRSFYTAYALFMCLMAGALAYVAGQWE